MIAILILLFYTFCLNASDNNQRIHDLFAQSQEEEKENNSEKAIATYTRILELDPHNFNALVKIASLYFEQKKFDCAITHFSQAAQLKPYDAHVQFNLGLSCMGKEDWQNAITAFEKALEHDPFHERASLNKGTCYEKMKQHQAAIAAYRATIEHHPQSFTAYHHLGILYNSIEQLENAVEPYAKAVSLQPTNVSLMMEYANILSTLDRHNEAIVWYKKMLEINPNILSAYYNIGYTLKKMGHLDEALKIYNQIIAQKSDYAPARFSRSGIYLMNGDFERGWDEYEWRFQAYDEKPERFNRPLWQGEELTNNSLIVYAEQGLGDTLQFIRFVHHLKKTIPNIRIVVEAQEPLVPLLKHQPYIDAVFARSEHPTFCFYQIPLLSIPRIIKTRLDTIPHDIPYIEVPKVLVDAWHEKLADDKNFKIGLCWQGNSHYSTAMLRRAVASKSIPLELLKPLSDYPHVTLYSLQRVTGTEQIASCSFKDKLIVFDDAFDTKNGRFMDTAAVIKNLDLVISVDTGICHLAGALDIPTWIMLPEPSDWRWLLNRTDSPWYPSVHLFKQNKAGDWESVVHAMIKKLDSILSQEEFNTKKIQ